MDHYHHLTIEQRENLLVCVNQGKKYAEIAAEIHCSESTVSREIRRNSASRQEYSAIKAQRAYEKRRKNSVRKPVLADPKAVQTVSNLLEMAWSPEQISNRLKYEHNQLKISTSTIYRALDEGLLDEKLCKKLRIKGRLRHGGRKKSKCGHLDIEYSIHDRPKSADKRKTIGHWESDTVRGSKWTGCIATHVERKSRYAVLCKIPNRTAEVFTQATIQAFQNIPKGKCKSFCADHGKEFSDYRIIQTELNCKVYFADPHAPWQRGTNENFNGLLRQFFPKRTSFAEVTQKDVEAVMELLNRRPRKSLGWKTPEEVFFHKVLHLT